MRQFGNKQCLKSYCKIFILVLLFLASSAVEVVKSYNVLLGDKLNRSIKVRKYRDKRYTKLHCGIRAITIYLLLNQKFNLSLMKNAPSATLKMSIFLAILAHANEG